MRIVVVGSCASGKTTLVESLKKLGFDAHSCAQEHSYVPYFWSRLHPDVLVFLECSVETMQRRTGAHWWDTTLVARERERLLHARQHSDLVICTDDLTPDEIVDQVVAFVSKRSFTN